MPVPDVEKMLALIRVFGWCVIASVVGASVPTMQRTAYWPTSDAKLTTHSAMASASKDLPGHVVKVIPKLERNGLQEP